MQSMFVSCVLPMLPTGSSGCPLLACGGHGAWILICGILASGAGFMNRRRLCQLTAAILTSDLTTHMRVL